MEIEVPDCENGEARCVMVGVQMDADGKELLDWTISKVAQQGDRIMAVHVCRDSELKNTTTMSLIKELDDYLAAYNSFCNLQQVALVGRVSRGNSIRKVLVKEAKLCNAVTVVVGIIKNNSLGSSASLAKYCAKKLPATTALVAVQNGKVIFEKKAEKPAPGKNVKQKLGTVLRPSMPMDEERFNKEKPIEQIKKVYDVESEADREEENANLCNANVKDNENGCSMNSDMILSRMVQEPSALGWPLLRRTATGIPEVKRDDEARKMSVVQWVMKLPNRSLPPSKAYLDLVSELKTILSNSTSGCKWFQYDELYCATNHFSSVNLIGKGGNSKVYKGCLTSGQQVAIKLSKLSEETSKDFLLEVDIITKLEHKGVVPLIGICIEDNTIISVYSYFSKGSLEENIHGNNMVKSQLSWDQRYKVAVGVAEALCYIHNGSSQPVIHRDVKSSNILLSENFEPQLSDFGLAMWAPTTSASLTHNDIVGTFGYLAPEYFMHGKVSEKIDVYAFGVVLLELLTGRKPIREETPKGLESLVLWAKPILERGNFMDALDPNLDSAYDEAQLKRMISAASLCITRTAHLRPQMSKILSLLGGEEIPEAWMSIDDNTTLNCHEEETIEASSIGSHLGLALLDVEDDASVTSFEQSYLGSLEEYLKGRWSRSSSFD